jgi:hypothetical protein
MHYKSKFIRLLKQVLTVFIALKDISIVVITIGGINGTLLGHSTPISFLHFDVKIFLLLHLDVKIYSHYFLLFAALHLILVGFGEIV